MSRALLIILVNFRKWVDVLQDLCELEIRLGVVVYYYSLSTEASRSELEAYIVNSRSSITNVRHCLKQPHPKQRDNSAGKSNYCENLVT